MEALKQLNFYRPQSLLSEQRETIEAHLRAHPPHTINEAISVIEALTGIRRSPTQIRVFLKHLGLKCLKVGLLPAKGDPQEQEAYQKKKLEPRLAEARAGERAVFFVDAAHFVFGAFLGYLWCFARCWIKAPSGRQRFSVLGALNAVTHDVITVTTLTYINSLTLPDYVDGVSGYSTYRIAATFPPPARGRIKVGVKAGSGLRARCFTKPFTPILNLPPLRGKEICRMRFG